MPELDFDEIKRAVSFESVLACYGVEMKGKRAKKCPLSGHRDRAGSRSAWTSSRTSSTASRARAVAT
jgi:hypothetical protein